MKTQWRWRLSEHWTVNFYWVLISLWPERAGYQGRQLDARATDSPRKPGREEAPGSEATRPVRDLNGRVQVEMLRPEVWTRSSRLGGRIWDGRSSISRVGESSQCSHLFLLSGGPPPRHVFSPALIVLLMPSCQPGWDLSLVSLSPGQTRVCSPFWITCEGTGVDWVRAIVYWKSQR